MCMHDLSTLTLSPSLSFSPRLSLSLPSLCPSLCISLSLSPSLPPARVSLHFAKRQELLEKFEYKADRRFAH